MSVRRAVWLSASGGYLSLVIQFWTVIVLTRILTHSEMGAYAVVIAIFNVLRPAADFGLTRYVIQMASVTSSCLRPVAAVGWGTGLLLAGAVWILAGPLADIYGSAAISTALRVMSLTLVLYPATLISGALLARSLRQDRIAFVNTANSVVQASTGVALAVSGFGTISLAIGYLAGFVAEFGLLLKLAPPGAFVAPGTRGLLQTIRVGAWLAGVSTTSQLGAGAPDIIVGNMLGLPNAGVYSRSVAIVGMLRRGLDVVTASVALPSFSRALHAGGDPRETYVKAIALMTGLTWPFLAALLVLADPIVNMIYGNRWREVAHVSRLVAAMSFGVPISLLAPSLLVALRKEAILFRIESLGQTLKIGSVLIAARWSLDAVAETLIAVAFVQTFIVVAVLDAIANVKVASLWRATKGSALIALATGGCCAVTLAAPFQGELPQFAAGLVSGGLGWILFVRITRHPLAAEIAFTCQRITKFMAALTPSSYKFYRRRGS